jgi:hypothetical protein
MACTYDDRRERAQADSETLVQFWSEPKHARLIDAEMVRFCVARATSHALSGDIRLSHSLAWLGIYLVTWFKLGKDTFLETRRGMPVEQNFQILLDEKASYAKIGTERGLLLFLSKQIPCSCLDEAKKNAKQAPKTGWCRRQHCNSAVPKLELKKCSQCESVGSVLLERGTNSRLESGTEEGMQNHQREERDFCRVQSPDGSMIRKDSRIYELSNMNISFINLPV